MRPCISVICPVYNKRTFLEGCVESCLSQNLESIELVMVDDGSTDGSLDELRRLAEQDDRIRVASQKNAGAAEARNTGLTLARGEFVFFLDPDDYIPAVTSLQRLYESAKRNDVMIAGGSMVIDRGGRVDRDSLHGRELDSFSGESVVMYEDYQYDYDYTRYIYSLDLLRREGIVFPPLRQFEDPVFFVRAMVAAERFSTIPDPVYAYRVAYRMEGSWSEQMVLDRIEGCLMLLEIAKELDYQVLYRYVVGQLDGEMRSALLDNAGSDRVLSAMCRANAAIDPAMLRATDPSQGDFYVLDALRKLARHGNARKRLRDSAIGKLAVYAKRKLRG